jgi:hypothetical protein
MKIIITYFGLLVNKKSLFFHPTFFSTDNAEWIEKCLACKISRGFAITSYDKI